MTCAGWDENVQGAMREFECPALSQSKDYCTEPDSFPDLFLIADDTAFQVGSRGSAVAGPRTYFKPDILFLISVSMD